MGTDSPRRSYVGHDNLKVELLLTFYIHENSEGNVAQNSCHNVLRSLHTKCVAHCAALVVFTDCRVGSLAVCMPQMDKQCSIIIVKPMICRSTPSDNAFGVHGLECSCFAVFLMF